MDSLNSLLAIKSRVVCPPRGSIYRESFAAQVETELARFGWLISPTLRRAIGEVPEDYGVAWAMCVDDAIPQLGAAQTCDAYSVRRGAEPGLQPMSDLLDQLQ